MLFEFIQEIIDSDISWMNSNNTNVLRKLFIVPEILDGWNDYSQHRSIFYEHIYLKGVVSEHTNYNQDYIYDDYNNFDFNLGMNKLLNKCQNGTFLQQLMSLEKKNWPIRNNYNAFPMKWLIEPSLEKRHKSVL